MTPRRSSAVEASVEPATQVEQKKVDLSKARKWSDVAKEVQALREKGATVPDICEQLQVSYVLVNQLVLQSYKMAIDSEAVFQRQEEMRLQAEG
ncbi:MAG: hypothetical protein ACO3RW_01890 [Burkholderiaceae bacterium]